MTWRNRSLFCQRVPGEARTAALSLLCRQLNARNAQEKATSEFTQPRFFTRDLQPASPAFILLRAPVANHCPQSRAGFTLVELLVVVFIMVMVASVVLVQNSRSQSDLVLTNDAYEVALAIREAQSFGVAVREAQTGTQFDVGYGVYFDAADPATAVAFNDLNKDQFYDPGDAELMQSSVTLSDDNVIVDFCGVLPGGGEECASGSLQELHITFVRPDPDANIIGMPGEAVYQEARITLSSPEAPTPRTVRVFATGQIAIE